MSWRQTELAHFADRLAWLDDVSAGEAYSEAIQYSSETHYGLRPRMARHIERIDVDETGDNAAKWLTERVGVGMVRIVFGKTDVCLAGASFVVANWMDMFCPSRDDVIVLPVMGDWILFYCHEDEFEFRIRSMA